MAAFLISQTMKGGQGHFTGPSLYVNGRAVDLSQSISAPSLGPEKVGFEGPALDRLPAGLDASSFILSRKFQGTESIGGTILSKIQLLLSIVSIFCVLLVLIGLSLIPVIIIVGFMKVPFLLGPCIALCVVGTVIGINAGIWSIVLSSCTKTTDFLNHKIDSGETPEQIIEMERRARPCFGATVTASHQESYMTHDAQGRPVSRSRTVVTYRNAFEFPYVMWCDLTEPFERSSALRNTRRDFLKLSMPRALYYADEYTKQSFEEFKAYLYENCKHLDVSVSVSDYLFLDGLKGRERVLLNLNPENSDEKHWWMDQKWSIISRLTCWYPLYAKLVDRQCVKERHVISKVISMQPPAAAPAAQGQQAQQQPNQARPYLQDYDFSQTNDSLLQSIDSYSPQPGNQQGKAAPSAPMQQVGGGYGYQQQQQQQQQPIFQDQPHQYYQSAPIAGLADWQQPQYGGQGYQQI